MEDFLVIGGGLIGLLTARELDAAGARVRLLERGTIGRGSSWAGGGILSPLHPWRYPNPVTELARWSQHAYRSLCETLRLKSGIDPQWTESGMLMLDVHDVPDALQWAAVFGYMLEPLDAERASTVEPALARVDGRSVWMPHVAQVRNPRLLKAVRSDLEQRGMPLLEGNEVTGLRIRGGRITGAETTQGTVEAANVVVASGAWSAELLREAGQMPAVEPVRGQMLLFRTEPGTVTRIVLRGERYIIPRRDGHVLVGSTMERVGFDPRVTDDAREELTAFAGQTVGALAAARLERHWAGLRPGSPTGVPYIGPHPEIDGLFVNAGQYRNGVVTAPASARLLADLALGRDPVLDPAPFAWDAPRHP